MSADPSTPVPTTVPTPTGAARPVVLVAEDVADSRQLLTRLLQHFTRAEVVEARNGPQALDEFRKHSPCISFLDIDMPEIDGLSVLQQIRSIDPRACVVIVTGTSSLHNVQQALARGAGGFVVKPFSTARILDVLQSCEARYGLSLLADDVT